MESRWKTGAHRPFLRPKPLLNQNVCLSCGRCICPGKVVMLRESRVTWRLHPVWPSAKAEEVHPRAVFHNLQPLSCQLISHCGKLGGKPVETSSRILLTSRFRRNRRFSPLLPHVGIIFICPARTPKTATPPDFASRGVFCVRKSGFPAVVQLPSGSSPALTSSTPTICAYFAAISSAVPPLSWGDSSRRCVTTVSVGVSRQPSWALL